MEVLSPDLNTGLINEFSSQQGGNVVINLVKTDGKEVDRELGHSASAA